MEVIDVEEKKTFKEKMEDKKQKVKEKALNAKDWCIKNKETLLIFAPIILSGTVKVLKEIRLGNEQRDERELREKSVYDRSKGHYYELKRKPSNRQWSEIDERRDRGEPLRDILEDMRLMK